MRKQLKGVGRTRTPLWVQISRAAPTKIPSCAVNGIFSPETPKCIGAFHNMGPLSSSLCKRELARLLGSWKRNYGRSRVPDSISRLFRFAPDVSSLDQNKSGAVRSFLSRSLIYRMDGSSEQVPPPAAARSKFISSRREENQQIKQDDGITHSRSRMGWAGVSSQLAHAPRL